MNKGETRYRITPQFTIEELTCRGRHENGFVLHNQEGEELIGSKYLVDNLHTSKLMLATELEEKLRFKLGQVHDYLRRHKQKFNPIDKPDVVYMTPNIREVHQYDLKGRYIQSFPSVKEATLSVDGNPLNNTIPKVCLGLPRFVTYKGFRWRYEKLKQLEPIIRDRYKPKHMMKEVHKYSMEGNYIETFPSISKAMLSLGLKPNSNSITKTLTGKSRYQSCKGFRWSLTKHNRI